MVTVESGAGHPNRGVLLFSADAAYRLLAYTHQHAAFRLGDGGVLPPYRAQFEITYRCNSFCRHCCKQHRPERLDDLPRELLTAHDWIALAHSLPRFTLITLTGGEPLMHPGFAEIIAGISRSRVMNLLTNATLLDEEMIDLLLRARVVLLGVPIYGVAERHNAVVCAPNRYEMAVDNLRRLRSRQRARGQRRPLLDLKTIVTADNLSEVDHLLELAAELDADYLTFSLGYDNPVMLNPFLKPDLSHHDFQRLHPFGPTDKTVRREFARVFRRLLEQGDAGRTRFRFYPSFPSPDLAEAFFLEPERFTGRMLPCTCPWGTIVVNPEGQAFPCLSVAVGSVRERSWRAVWRGPAFRDFRRTIRAAGALPACWGCCYVSIDFSSFARGEHD
jgi:MoaA/NifB/PqqE/SkfB family radical SAM enzyme